MNKQIARIAVVGSKINRNQIQAVFAVLALCMLVLGIGAPSDGGH